MISILLTIFIYLFVYCVATLIFMAADKSKSVINERNYILLGILFLSLFACCRDIHVGTDTAETISLYLNDQVNRVLEFNSITDFINGNILYFILAKLLGLFHLGEKSFMFLMEFFIVMPIAICARMRKNRIPIHITMAIFMLLYYQLGFNWIRQSIASAFVLLGLTLAEEKKGKQSIAVFIIAVLFHSSAVIGGALLFFTYTFMRLKNKYVRAIFGIGFMVLFMFLVMNWDRLFAIGINYGILPPTYAGYLRVFTGQTTVSRWFQVGRRTYVDYILRVLIVILPLILVKSDSNSAETRTINYYKMTAIVGLILYSYVLFGMHSAYGNRITYTIEYVSILNLGMSYKESNGSKWIVPLRNIVIFGLIISYNIWLYYVLGWHDTVPFIFSL